MVNYFVDQLDFLNHSSHQSSSFAETAPPIGCSSVSATNRPTPAHPHTASVSKKDCTKVESLSSVANRNDTTLARTCTTTTLEYNQLVQKHKKLLKEHNRSEQRVEYLEKRVKHLEDVLGLGAHRSTSSPSTNSYTQPEQNISTAVTPVEIYSSNPEEFNYENVDEAYCPPLTANKRVADMGSSSPSCNHEQNKRAKSCEEDPEQALISLLESKCLLCNRTASDCQGECQVGRSLCFRCGGDHMKTSCPYRNETRRWEDFTGKMKEKGLCNSCLSVYDNCCGSWNWKFNSWDCKVKKRLAWVIIKYKQSVRDNSAWDYYILEHYWREEDRRKSFLKLKEFIESGFATPQQLNMNGF